MVLREREREIENGEKDFGNIAKSQTRKTSQMNELKRIKEIVVGIKS